jgi:DNA polymerase III alpha subunit
MDTKKGRVVDSTKDVKVNMYGQAILSSNNLRELLLQGKNIGHLNVDEDEEISLHKKYQAELLSEQVLFLDPPPEDLTFDEFHQKCAEEWIFPTVYQQIDVHTWLLDKCKTQEEIDRVNQEYELYKERDLIMLLRLFIFLVDYMRKNKFVWGVGRGSSVSSYILYLIGIHRVDSIKYGFDIRDYLK